MDSLGLVALVALAVLIVAGKQHRTSVLMAVAAMVVIVGPSVVIHTVLGLVPGIS